jgi:hypothetical protein
MNNNQINFKVLFRRPKYPVIVIDDNDIWAASGITELGTICVISEPVGKGGKMIKDLKTPIFGTLIHRNQ